MYGSIDDLVKAVVENEGGSGSVYLDGFQRDGQFFLGVVNDDDMENPRYESLVVAHEASISTTKQLLETGGMNVITSEKEWKEMCADWEELGS